MHAGGSFNAGLIRIRIEDSFFHRFHNESHLKCNNSEKDPSPPYNNRIVSIRSRMLSSYVGPVQTSNPLARCALSLAILPEKGAGGGGSGGLSQAPGGVSNGSRTPAAGNAFVRRIDDGRYVELAFICTVKPRVCTLRGRG